MATGNVINIEDKDLPALQSMNDYWQEIAKRDEPEKVCRGELLHLVDAIGARNILLIVGEYVASKK